MAQRWSIPSGNAFLADDSGFDAATAQIKSWASQSW
jgi:hypothetical protein